VSGSPLAAARRERFRLLRAAAEHRHANPRRSERSSRRRWQLICTPNWMRRTHVGVIGDRKYLVNPPLLDGPGLVSFVRWFQGAELASCAQLLSTSFQLQGCCADTRPDVYRVDRTRRMPGVWAPSHSPTLGPTPRDAQNATQAPAHAHRCARVHAQTLAGAFSPSIFPCSTLAW